MKAKKSQTTSLSCSQCGKEFKYDSERKRHEQSHFQLFECGICAKKFSFVSALRRHEKQHERLGTVNCEQCGRKFRDEILLKRHVNYAHKGSFSCTKCSSVFNSQLALRVHMKTHKPESEKQFKCSHSDCGKKFNFSHHLKHHELTHTETKLHHCEDCGKGFIQYHHWKSHITTHNPDQWLSCPMEGCEKKFANKYTRKRHLEKHKKKPSIAESSDSNSSDPTTKETNTATLSKVRKHSDISNLNTQKENPVYDSDNIIERPRVLDSTEDSHSKDSTSSCSDDYINETVTKKLDSACVNDCKTVLGGCIANASGNDCLCEQMADSTDDDYEIKPCETNIQSSVPKILKNEYTVPNVTDCNTNCLDCECANSCQVMQLNDKAAYQNNARRRDKTPQLEFRNDGVIKLRSTFDMDLLSSKDAKIANDPKVFPYSCKAILGNCIVSGNDTIGEGCLCAKMLIDEQQALAEEIDDITPRPNMYN